MGFETKWAGAAIRPTRDRRAPQSHRDRSWIERLLSSAVRTVVEGFALYGSAYVGVLYPGPFLPAEDQPRFLGFGDVRRDGSRAAREGIDNQPLKDIGIADEVMILGRVSAADTTDHVPRPAPQIKSVG
jgi:hypothetical protein